MEFAHRIQLIVPACKPLLHSPNQRLGKRSTIIFRTSVLLFMCRQQVTPPSPSPPSESPFKRNFFETISDCLSAPLPSLSPPRCFLSCQKASLQVNSDLRMSSPRGRLRHSLLPFFKRHLSGSLLSALPSRPTPSSSTLLPSSLLPARLLQWLLETEPASLLKGTLVHGPHLLPAPSFN